MMIIWMRIRSGVHGETRCIIRVLHRRGSIPGGGSGCSNDSDGAGVMSEQEEIEALKRAWFKHLATTQEEPPSALDGYDAGFQAGRACLRTQQVIGEPHTEPQGEEAKRNECDCLRRPDSEGMPSGLKPDSPASCEICYNSHLRVHFWEDKVTIYGYGGYSFSVPYPDWIAKEPEMVSSNTIAVLKQAAEVLNPFRAGTIHKWNPKTKEVMLLEISLRELSSLHTAITEELKRLGEV